jgi:hypothetical protein
MLQRTQSHWKCLDEFQAGPPCQGPARTLSGSSALLIPEQRIIGRIKIKMIYRHVYRRKGTHIDQSLFDRDRIAADLVRIV